MNFSVARATARSQRRGPRLAAGPVASIVSAAALLFVAVAYVGFVMWPRNLSEVAADAPSLPVTIAGVSFNLPTAAIRQPVQRHSGAQERVDLVFLWPSLEPPDPLQHPDTQAALEEMQPIERLFVTIAASNGTLSAAERIKTIYPRYIVGEAQREAEGLAARPFGDETPYKGEDLVYDPAAPERFVARCSRAGATPATCLMERRIGATDIMLRFPRGWLDQWRELGAKLDGLIATLRPPAR